MKIGNIDRVAAEVFIVPGGVGFVDIGWNSPYLGANPFHIVHGRLESYGERFWTFIDETGRTIHFWVMDEYDQLLEDWIAWLKARHEQGRPYDREEVQKALIELSAE